MSVYVVVSVAISIAMGVLVVAVSIIVVAEILSVLCVFISVVGGLVWGLPGFGKGARLKNRGLLTSQKS